MRGGVVWRSFFAQSLPPNAPKQWIYQPFFGTVCARRDYSNMGSTTGQVPEWTVSGPVPHVQQLVAKD